MQTVLSRSLGPIRWALAASDGIFRKINKPTNGDVVEKPALLVDGISVNSACIIGGMSIVQKLKGNHTTFDFRKILMELVKNKHCCDLQYLF